MKPVITPKLKVEFFCCDNASSWETMISKPPGGSVVDRNAICFAMVRGSEKTP